MTLAFGGTDLSPKGYPELSTCQRLCEEMLKDGCVTEGEPLLVTFPTSASGMPYPPNWPPEAPRDEAITPQSVTYTKGLARSSTLLSLLSVCLDSEVDIAERFPLLHHSALRLQCQHVHIGTHRERLFYNFKLSVRGSIRRAPHVFTWVQALQRMAAQQDGDAMHVIRAWNQQASKSTQLTGAKYCAVHNVLKLMPATCVEVACAHIGAYGWDQSCFSEHVLQSKRIFPPHTFRVISNRTWAGRGVVTEESMFLMLKWVITEFEGHPDKCKSRVSRARFEEVRWPRALLQFLSFML